ncbi:MAG: right-handed parallel beta-helix repeat-containing protein, partial [Saprospiraceae bacterium]|nr:right-handed parallel beta-helix repeat-containing protein [Saprospiraceae bacterium]
FAERYAGKVEHCTMTGVDLGVDWQKSPTRDVRIRNNDITANRYGVRSFLNEPTHPDVSAIQTNDITITTQNNGGNPNAGIRLDEGQLGTAFESGWPVLANNIVMDNGGNGIRYTNGLAGRIENNAINNQDATDNYTGIHLEGDLYSLLTGNTISQTTSGGNLGDTYGIYSTAGWANAFTCNCLDNTAVGMQFYDMADFTNAVRGNSFYTHTTGMQLGDDAQTGTYIGKQVHTGNLWDLAQIPSGNYGATNWDTLVLGLSPFYVDQVENAGFLPPVFPISNWFNNLNDPKPSFSCSSACTFTGALPPHDGESDSPTGLDEAIVDNLLPGGAFPATTRWKGEYRLYRKILRRPALENVAMKDTTFKTSRSTQPVGKLASIAEERAKLYQLTSAQHSTLEGYRTTFLQKTAEIRTQDSLRQAGSMINESAYATLVSQRNIAADQIQAFYYTLDTARISKINTLLVQNTAVVDTILPATNQKGLNDILLRFLKTDSLATGDLDDLIAIAEQCPLEGGDAVLEARALVGHFTGQGFDDYTACGNAQQRQFINSEKDGAVVLKWYPNPTTGMIFFPDIQGEVKAEVYNQLGQLQLRQNLTDARLDLGLLPNGVYVVRLLREEQAPVTRSVVLNKN